MQLRGVLGPVISTFQPGSENLDVASFTSNLNAHLSAGLHGVVVCGSTGEAALLSDDERRVLLDAARGVTPKDRVLIMGTGAESTRQTIKRCADAKAGGADAVLVVAPHYYASAMTLEALRIHYRAVADASPVPVLLYNIPKYMHFALPAELVAELAQHPNVVGIKDSSGNLDMLKGFLRAQSDSFTVLTGNASTFVPALEAGARGGILAVALFAPALCLQMYDAFRAGNGAAAADAQEVAKPLASVIVAELGVPGVKTACDVVGLRGGVPRRPLVELDEAGEQRVREVLAGVVVAA
ncbi:MAG TPA: dihydrodipicolinate synthase family protein [Gemmatimonadaceae bacterium]|nr:dihydrodipicolinate synthase family protein [Gemmatimonadaceae bacterium]